MTPKPIDKINKKLYIIITPYFPSEYSHVGSYIYDQAKAINNTNDFVVKVISSTGNYGEIYNRHLGQNSAVPIPRGLNKLYKDGGIHISPPFN